jgi:hypothetical protein
MESEVIAFPKQAGEAKDIGAEGTPSIRDHAPPMGIFAIWITNVAHIPSDDGEAVDGHEYQKQRAGYPDDKVDRFVAKRLTF